MIVVSQSSYPGSEWLSQVHRILPGGWLPVIKLYCSPHSGHTFFLDASPMQPRQNVCPQMGRTIGFLRGSLHMEQSLLFNCWEGCKSRTMSVLSCCGTFSATIYRKKKSQPRKWKTKTKNRWIGAVSKFILSDSCNPLFHPSHWLTISSGDQGPVVQKLISANPGLKVNQGFNTLV